MSSNGSASLSQVAARHVTAPEQATPAGGALPAGPCPCGCGRELRPGSAYAEDACRKSAWRARQVAARPQVAVVDAAGKPVGLSPGREAVLLVARLAELVPALQARLDELGPDATAAALAEAAARAAGAEARAAAATAAVGTWAAEAEGAASAARAAEARSQELSGGLSAARESFGAEHERAELLAGQLLVCKARATALEAEVDRLTDRLAAAAKRSGLAAAPSEALAVMADRATPPR